MDEMKFDMLVASVANTHKVMDVTLPNGDTVKAPVPVIEVELVDETGKHGSRKMTFISAEEKEFAVAHYVQGEMITVSA